MIKLSKQLTILLTVFILFACGEENTTNSEVKAVIKDTNITSDAEEITDASGTDTGGKDTPPVDSITAKSLSIPIEALENNGNISEIVFYFQEEYEIGQFVNGDWWVHNNGSDVVITRITPDSYNDNGRVRHGAELNPQNSSHQGYDGLSNVDTADMPYDATKNIDPTNLGADLVIPPSSSLIKAVSRVINERRPALANAEVLTILAKSPPLNAFRPPLVGSDKTMEVTTDDINYQALGSVERLSTTIDISAYEAFMIKPFLDYNTEWTQRDIHPENNFAHGYVYGRDIAKTTAEIGVQLQLNYSDDEKKTVLINYIQYAIDLYGVLKNDFHLATGEKYFWYNNGGHNQGRKLPILISGLVLNHEGMLGFVNGQAGENLLFQEDQQTFYITQYDIDNYPEDDGSDDPYKRFDFEYTAEDIGLAEWGIRNWSNKSLMNANWGAKYRDVNGSATVATALAIFLMEAEDEWNYSPFTDYAKRYYQLVHIDENEITTDVPGATNNLIRTVVADLWDANLQLVDKN